jgi:hypothetical protein
MEKKVSATCRPSPPSTMAPTPSCSAASATSSCRWATGRNPRKNWLTC